MVKHCAASGCFTSQTHKGIHFYRFLIERPQLLKKWLQKMKLKNPPIDANSRICSEHFSSDCYLRDLRSELIGSKPLFRLKEESVPTIFDFTGYDNVTDVSGTSGVNSTAQLSSTLKRLQRSSSNKKIQEIHSALGSEILARNEMEAHQHHIENQHVAIDVDGSLEAFSTTAEVGTQTDANSHVSVSTQTVNTINIEIITTGSMYHSAPQSSMPSKQQVQKTEQNGSKKPELNIFRKRYACCRNIIILEIPLLLYQKLRNAVELN